MGDLVLGLAKTVVEGTLLKARSAIDEEAKLKQSVKRDLVFITGEFQMLQCFLNVTDEEGAKNVVVKAWVRQLRDLAYDVEDCIEFVVHLDKKPAWWWRVVPSCMAPALPLDMAVASIKEIKERVIDISQRNMRYKPTGDSGSGSRPPVIALAIAGATDPFDMLAEASYVAKKQHGLWDLGELINRQDRDLQVISLWGTSSDLGIKSIISESYDDPKTCQTFTCRAWVNLVHPFNPHEFIRSLLAQFFADSCQEQQTVLGVDVMKMMKTTATTTEDDLMEEFVRRVREHRYLVVLENLCSTVDWRTAKTYLPDMKNGSRIVVSTQQFEIASLCTGHPYNISEISQLSPDHSVCVLFKEDELGATHPFESEAARTLEMLKGVDNEIRRNNKSSAFHVMSVWGIPGVGKSALVRSIYLGQMERKYSHRWGKYAWVNVPHPFDLEQFCRSLLWDLFPATTEVEVQEYLDEHWFISCEELCQSVLDEHRCLIVIDGLDSLEQWDEINTALRLGASKGRIIVITSNESLAIHHDSLVCNIETSEHDATRYRFKDQDSQHDKENNPDGVSNTVTPRHDNFHLLGRRSEAANILHILNQYSSHVMSVWGIAGVGKSSLVRSIYCDQKKKICRHSWSKQSWANVLHPFNLREFCRSLLLDLSSKSAVGKVNEYFGISIMEDPIKQCRDILREHRCLVVIDNLQSIEDWDSINDALGLRSANGDTIVITNEASIAIHCADKDFHNTVCNIRSLEHDDAIRLYQDQIMASPGGDYRLTIFESDSDRFRELILKCGGLPKVIIAVCRFLINGYSGQAQLSKLTGQFINSLENSMDCDDLRGLLIWMHSYFRSCPDFLKPCVFYLPIFPPYYDIRRKRLLRRWIAEGYSRCTVNATAEQNVEDSFDKLTGLSMIQWPPQEIKLEYMSRTLCQINGFFHEYIMSQPMEDNMVFALEEGRSQDRQCTGRHLTIRSSWNRDANVFESVDFSRLRSLTVFGEWRPFFISTKMRLLRVLDLEDTTSDVSDEDLEQIVELLSQLKFLSLRGCKSVSHLPTSLGNLKQLETLDVRHTSITMLPRSITKLQKLQYIRAGSAVPTREFPSIQPVSCMLPRGIGKLTALHTLGVVNAGAAGGKSIMKELKNLTQLRKLGVSGINADSIDDFWAAIRAHRHLESLSVRFAKDMPAVSLFEEYLPESLLMNLRSLKVYRGHGVGFPVWIDGLSSIQKMDLEMTILTQQMIDRLANWHCQRLRLCVTPIQDAEHNFSFHRFEHLQILEIDCSSRLVLTFGEDTPHKLELLKIHCSGGLQISGQARLGVLKQVWLIGSCDEALKQDVELQLAEYPNEFKPVLKLEEASSCGCRCRDSVSFCYADSMQGGFLIPLFFFFCSTIC